MVENGLWKMLAFIVLSVMLFIAPLYFMFIRQDMVTNQIVTVETEKFADKVRDLGYITPDMYMEFVDDIHATGLTYDIQLSHYNKQFFPDQKSPGDYMLGYEGYYNNQILDVLFPENNLSSDSPKRVYNLYMGDYFLIEVNNKGKTKADVMRSMFSLNDSDIPVIMLRAGGMVYSED
ncbi:MAG: hypothetical protein ACLFMO_01665 [Eubacteriales bacterium]